jgi:hypothetical protein
MRQPPLGSMNSWCRDAGHRESACPSASQRPLRRGSLPVAGACRADCCSLSLAARAGSRRECDADCPARAWSQRMSFLPCQQSARMPFPSSDTGVDVAGLRPIARNWPLTWQAKGGSDPTPGPAGDVSGALQRIPRAAQCAADGLVVLSDRAGREHVTWGAAADERRRPCRGLDRTLPCGGYARPIVELRSLPHQVAIINTAIIEKYSAPHKPSMRFQSENPKPCCHLSK